MAKLASLKKKWGTVLKSKTAKKYRALAYRHKSAVLKHKFILTIVILLVAVLAAGKLVHSFNKSNQGSVQGSNQAAQSAPTDTVDFGNLIAVNGKYVDFEYPAALNHVSSDRPAGIVLETFSYSKPPVPYWNLSIVVYQLSSGRLADNTQYAYRKIRPSEFSQEVIKFRQQSVTVMASKTGFAKTAFMPSADKLATITLTGGLSDASQLQKTLELVVASFAWVSR